MTGGLQRELEVDQDLRHPQFRGLVDNQKVPLVGPNGTVAVPKQRLYGAEQLVDVQVIRVAQLGLGLLLGLDVVCLVLQMPERADGGNYFHRAGTVAQLLAQQASSRGHRPVQDRTVTPTLLIGSLKIAHSHELPRSSRELSEEPGNLSRSNLD